MSRYIEEKRINDYNKENDDIVLHRYKFKWLTFILVILAGIFGFILKSFFSTEPGHINALDYLAAVFSAAAFITTFFFIPRKLKAISFVITGLMTVFTLLALIPYN